VTQGYFNVPAATAEAFETVAPTGDIGEVDESGACTWRGRKRK